MWLLPSDNASLEMITYRVKETIEKSRFSAVLETGRVRYRPGLKVSYVRVRTKKSYCGAHPGPCQALGIPRRIKRATFLEGLDWVGFNAMLNDVLDDMSADCDVFSYNRESINLGRYYIRKDRRRRMAYPFAFADRFAHWTQTKQDLFDLFEDHCGKPHPPISDSLDGLEGTPGYPCYTLEEEVKFAETHQEH